MTDRMRDTREQLERALRTLTFAWSRRRTISFETNYRCVYSICLHGGREGRADLRACFLAWVGRACAHVDDATRFRALVMAFCDLFLFFFNKTVCDERERHALRRVVPCVLWAQRVVGRAACRAAFGHWVELTWRPPAGRAFQRLKRGFGEVAQRISPGCA